MSLSKIRAGMSRFVDTNVIDIDYIYDYDSIDVQIIFWNLRAEGVIGIKWPDHIIYTVECAFTAYRRWLQAPRDWEIALTFPRNREFHSRSLDALLPPTEGGTRPLAIGKSRLQ